MAVAAVSAGLGPAAAPPIAAATASMPEGATAERRDRDHRRPSDRDLLTARRLLVVLPALTAAAGIPIGGPNAAAVFIAACIGISAVNREVLRLHLSVVSESSYLARRLGVCLAVTLPAVALGPHPTRLGIQVAVSIAVALVARAMAYAWLRRVRISGRLLEPTLIVGTGEVARTFVETLERHPEYGLWVVGSIDDGDPALRSIYTVGGLDDLPALVDALNVRRVVLAPCVGHGYDRTRAVREAQRRGVVVHVLPRFGELLPGFNDPAFDLVHGFPLFRLPSVQPIGLRWAAKRFIDIVVSLVLIVLTLPVMAVAAIGVRLTSKGPILFRQPRVGVNGRRFTMLKFRSFPADHRDVAFSLAHDDCPLPWGRLLRRTSIDEFPQLLNVLRGDMSLVGPRPERPHFAGPLTESVQGYGDRHRVRGGITGLAQVHGLWGDTSIEERVRLDNRYIESWSLWGDLVIMIKTLPAVLRKSRS